ncbi:hypothetical protein GLE_2952 [Lysobacter enzymogenes]|uniref:Uncharacterized protein n=1 Tax=Lysobacter enzymogenes TaxID=69 RepID=A0A0S2DIE1_LYSEN|nr:hypothetical protein GLE_2952 [Lysobacter enzymogenes]
MACAARADRPFSDTVGGRPQWWRERFFSPFAPLVRSASRRWDTIAARSHWQLSLGIRKL